MSVESRLISGAVLLAGWYTILLLYVAKWAYLDYYEPYIWIIAFCALMTGLALLIAAKDAVEYRKELVRRSFLIKDFDLFVDIRIIPQ